MGKRREGREAAVQFLFNRDLSGAGNFDAEHFWRLRPTVSNARTFGSALIEGVLQHQTEIDERISRYVQNYKLERIGVVDRNVLRLALYEMFYRPDIPPVVTINEAIEVAKKFGTEESGRFVNGLLERAKLDLNRPLRSPSAPASAEDASLGKNED